MHLAQSLKDKGKIRYRPDYSVQYGANGSRTVVQTGTDLTQAGSPDVPPSPWSQTVKRMREAKQAKTHQVYFLYCAGRIKIGMSNHAQRRVLLEISPYCVAPLIIIGTIPGGKILEARLHDRFAANIDHGEWFHLDPDLRDFLCENANRAKRLAAAVEDYREWLHDELNHLGASDDEAGDCDADQDLRSDDGGRGAGLDQDNRPEG